MSREWVDDLKPKPIDRRWVMRCDRNSFGPGVRCATESEPQRDQADLPLERFVTEGWFIAEKQGDLCPRCLADGHLPTKEPWVGRAKSDVEASHIWSEQRRVVTA